MDGRKFNFKKKPSSQAGLPFQELSTNVTNRRQAIKKSEHCIINSPPSFSSTQMIGKELSVDSFFSCEDLNSIPKFTEFLDISAVSQSPIVLSKTVELFSNTKK